MFAFRVHAHSHGDVNTAYRVRDDEWTQLAKGDPQWPQAFYPVDQPIDIKDGDSLLGICTYHNDDNKYVYAGSTHNDEMCNVYLMYYTDNAEDVMGTCSGNTYPKLESAIPDEAQIKPAAPASFSSDGKKDSMSHHDMEGSKLHHEIPDQKTNNKQQLNQKALSYILSKSGLSDDYYDDIERGRSKGRNNKYDGNNGDEQQSFYDTNALLDALGDDDYGSQSDDASSLLLPDLNGAKASQIGKIKSQLNKLSTITSKTKHKCETITNCSMLFTCTLFSFDKSLALN